MDDNIRAGQIQSRSACFQGNTEHRSIILIELFYHLRALFFFRASLQDEITDIFLEQAVCQKSNHGGKLREQQDFVSGFHCAFNQLHT